MHTRSSVKFCPCRFSGQAGNAKWIVLFTVFLVCVSILAYIFISTVPSTTEQKITSQTIARDNQPESPASTATENLVGVSQLPAGWVTIYDRWGNQLSKERSVLIDDAWLALPIRACYGGEAWIFTADSGKETRIDGGYWKKGDSIGLWHLEGVPRGQFDAPAIPKWDQSKNLQWLSLYGGEPLLSVKISPVRRHNFYTQYTVGQSITEPGVFIQNNKIIGWTFGKVLAGGYMWNGSNKNNLDDAWIWIDDFYTATFANGREEHFLQALAMANSNASYAEQLAVFVEGLRLEPKLKKEDTPAQLHSEVILKHMRALVAQILATGTYKDFADIFEDPFLFGLAQKQWMLDALRTTASTYGYDNAIDLTETALANRQASEEQIDAFMVLHAQFNKEWLDILLEDGDFRSGWQVYAAAKEYHPYDPEIHLAGVELALGESDWQEAERLLYMRKYPTKLSNRVMIFESRISQLKAQAGKIVVRFQPGHQVIPVKALLNDQVEQQFVIDTGASMVTIPSSTADRLGIEIDEYTPRRQVYTAGGVEIAYEVVLSAIELQGWVVYDVKAFVLDIPNQTHLGLLGLNYLNRFRMNLDNEKGVLLLEPR